jgi:HAD superfamily hydrolase (TIGR01509 family)
MTRPSTPVVTLDLGGVVVRIAPTLERMAARSGVRLREPDRSADRAEIDRLLRAWTTGRISDDELFDRWTAAHAGRFDRAEAARLSLGTLLEEYDGVCELLEELRDAGFVTGCLSNTCNHHWAHVLARAEAYPAMQQFAHRHASHLLGEMKPDARIYRRYERAVGAAADGIVFFDDTPVNVQAARALGWRAFRIDPEGSPAAQMREHLGACGIRLGG